MEAKTRFEKLQRVTISEADWTELKTLFIITIDADGNQIWSHKGVNERIDQRTITSAENGQKGGRPTNENKPNKPNEKLGSDRLQEPKNNLTENLIKPKKAIEGNRTELNRTENKYVSILFSGSVVSKCIATHPDRDGLLRAVLSEKFNLSVEDMTEELETTKTNLEEFLKAEGFSERITLLSKATNEQLMKIYNESECQGILDRIITKTNQPK